MAVRDETDKAYWNGYIAGLMEIDNYRQAYKMGFIEGLDYAREKVFELIRKKSLEYPLNDNEEFSRLLTTKDIGHYIEDLEIEYAITNNLKSYIKKRL